MRRLGSNEGGRLLVTLHYGKCSFTCLNTEEEGLPQQEGDSLVEPLYIILYEAELPSSAGLSFSL